MRTLIDEYRKRRDATRVFHSVSDANMYHEGAEAALAEYGSWRVVEGELVEATNRRGPLGGPPSLEWREVSIWDGEEYTNIGAIGDNVKLILPPEEKKEEPVAKAMLRVMAAEERARRRANKFEQALREIEGHGAIASYVVIRDIAREALDD